MMPSNDIQNLVQKNFEYWIFRGPENLTKLPIIPQKAGYTKVPLLVIKIA